MRACELSRADTARQALFASRLIVAKIGAVRGYLQRLRPGTPDIQTAMPVKLVDDITSAGSVFSATVARVRWRLRLRINDVPPTYGYTSTCSSLGLAISRTDDRTGTVPRRLHRPAATVKRWPPPAADRPENAVTCA
ncbi:hypothetical protein ACNKHQ_11980 [Shigella flexneri]